MTTITATRIFPTTTRPSTPGAKKTMGPKSEIRKKERKEKSKQKLAALGAQDQL